MADGGKRTLDRVAGADVLPVFRREVIEGEQRLAILGQEAIEGLLGIVAALGHPDFLEVRLGSGLNRFRQLVQDVERFMEPTALMHCFSTSILACR